MGGRERMKDAFQFRLELQGVKSYWQLCDFHGRASDGVWFRTQQDNWASLSTSLHSILTVGEMGSLYPAPAIWSPGILCNPSNDRGAS